MAEGRTLRRVCLEGTAYSLTRFGQVEMLRRALSSLTWCAHRVAHRSRTAMHSSCSVKAYQLLPLLCCVDRYPFHSHDHLRWLMQRHPHSATGSCPTTPALGAARCKERLKHVGNACWGNGPFPSRRMKVNSDSSIRQVLATVPRSSLSACAHD